MQKKTQNHVPHRHHSANAEHDKIKVKITDRIEWMWRKLSTLKFDRKLILTFTLNFEWNWYKNLTPKKFSMVGVWYMVSLSFLNLDDRQNVQILFEHFACHQDSDSPRPQGLRIYHLSVFFAVIASKFRHFMTESEERARVIPK